uniref:Uncharacterized protein n=1 Tax=Anopheles culicifacies TaxID=139723 RepID=A0A182MFV6_9DIPT
MSTAYKHLYSCITFLIFIVVLNFFKNRVHVNRERAANKLKRAGTLHRPLAYEGIGEEFLFDFPYLELEDSDQVWQWDRSKQYPGRCLDVEIFFVFQPKRTILRRRVLDGPEGLHYRSTVLSERDKKKETLHQTDSTGSNSSIYMFLSVLVVLLLAAGVDIAKHLTGTGRNTAKEDAQRRLSLQNYQALIREKQKQFRMMKQHYSQPSMSVQRSIDESALPFAGTFSRMEESTPTAMMSLAGKTVPAPLLRRQSVPTLMRSQIVPAGGSTFSAAPSVPPFGRRTSVDSFWEVDHAGKAAGSSNGSPPEVRRRVRMLHRH